MMSLSGDDSLFSEHGKEGKAAVTAVLSPRVDQFRFIRQTTVGRFFELIIAPASFII